METAPSSYARGSIEETRAQIKDQAIARTLFGPGVFKDSDVKSIPQFKQSQTDLTRQLLLLNSVANRLGLYDAADHIARGLK